MFPKYDRGKYVFQYVPAENESSPAVTVEFKDDVDQEAFLDYVKSFMVACGYYLNADIILHTAPHDAIIFDTEHDLAQRVKYEIEIHEELKRKEEKTVSISFDKEPVGIGKQDWNDFWEDDGVSYVGNPFNFGSDAVFTGSGVRGGMTEDIIKFS